MGRRREGHREGREEGRGVVFVSWSSAALEGERRPVQGIGGKGARGMYVKLVV